MAIRRRFSLISGVKTVKMDVPVQKHVVKQHNGYMLNLKKGC